MKRFLQKSYSWLATLLFAVAFAVSGNVAAATITLPLNNGSGTVDGVSYFYTSGDWNGTANIYGEGDINAGWGTIQISCWTENIVKVELDCYNNGWSSNGLSAIAYTVIENSDRNGTISVDGHKAIWEGSANQLNFSASDDVDVRSIVVYTAEAGNDGGSEVKAVELPLAFTTSSGGTVDGVGFYMWSADWVSSTELYGEGDANATWGTVNITCPSKNIVKVELTCALNSWSSVGSAEAAAATVVETEDLGGSFSTNGNVAVWEGSSHSLTFSSSDDIDVKKIVVYVEEDGSIVKDCSIDVDYFADNCKPGKMEHLTKYITLYMQGNTATTSYTGSDNCPESVTLTNEAGQQFPISQFNYWTGSNQIGVVLQNEIDAIGTYTLHIPEGLVAFQGGKFNKEINVTWEIVAPDTREQKDVTFDFSQDFVNLVDGIVATTDGTHNAYAQGLQVKSGKTLSFTAPENASIVKVVLNHSVAMTGSGLQVMTADSGETHISGDYQSLTWTGDATSVTFTSGYTVYLGNVVVTLAVEGGSTEPVLSEDEIAYPEWKKLFETYGAVEDIAYNYGYQVPTEDVVGKKPAAVAAPIVELYNNVGGLAVNAPYDLCVSILAESWNTTIHENYAYALELLAAYEAAEVVTEVAPSYTEPVLSAEDVSNEVAYYIYTEARGGLTVTDAAATQLVGTSEAGVGQQVDPTDVRQQFAFVNWNDNLYLYSLATEKFIGKANRGNFTDEPVDPILFKNAGNGTVMLYFDNNFNINLGGSKQVTIDSWKDKDPGNSFIIKVAEKFDQTALLDKLNGGSVTPEVPTVDVNEFAGEWLFIGEGAYCNSPENIDGSLSPKETYNVNIEVENGNIAMTGLVGRVYEEPGYYVGTYNAAAGTLSFTVEAGFYGGYIIDNNYEYYLLNGPIVFNVSKDEDGKITLYNDNGWKFIYEDWYYSQHECGYTSIRMTKDGEMPEVEPNPELLKYAGNYLFAGQNPTSVGDYVTEPYYECEITVYGNELHLTGFLGEVEGKQPYLVGKYDADNNRIRFTHPSADGGFIKAENGTEYYADFFYVSVEGEEGSYVLNHPNTLNFYAYVDGQYYNCKYDSFKFIQNGEIPEETIWNGNIILPEDAASIDDLLSYNVEFEGANEVKAAATDVLGAIFDATGNPYAIVYGNDVFSMLGSVKFQGSKAVVEFVKISDLNTQLQQSAKAAAAKIGAFTTTPGFASVVFAGKSFKVDGELVYDMIQKDYTVAGGEPTGIESIQTTGNDSIYDLSGRRVKSTNPGLYIKNGVKVYMK